MAETPQQYFERVSKQLTAPPVEEWDTWPFQGPVVPRPLDPLLEREPDRHGENGDGCEECTKPDGDYLWTNENWRLEAFPEIPALPVIVLLLPRAHYQEPSDLPDALAADLGVMVKRLDAAVRSVSPVERVHICRWGEGGAHLHWWFIGRPALMGQLRSSFAAVWDDVLPRIPKDVWEANLAEVVAHLESSN